MGSGSGWNFRRSIFRYSQKRLKTLSCGGKRGSCIHRGDFSVEISSEFQPSIRSLQSALITKPYTDSLEGNSSSILPLAAPLTPARHDGSPQASNGSPEIAHQYDHDKGERYLAGSSDLESPSYPQPEAQAQTEGQETHAQQVMERKGRPLIPPEPKKGILKAGISIVHESEIPSTVYQVQSGCQPETSEAGTADQDDLMQEKRYKPTVAPEPKKGILKAGISMVLESEVPCDHKPETYADGDCSTKSSKVQQKNTSNHGQTAVNPAGAHRNSGDLGRSFSLVRVPQSRGLGASPLMSHPSAIFQSAGAAIAQVQPCSHCQNTYDLGKKPRVLKAEQIKRVTNSFCKKNFLDNGEWEFVYKGCLEGQPVAVKTIRHEGSNAKFAAEIAVLACLQHPNIVSLIGYCVEDNDRALVYSYACNRNLHWHLCCVANGTKLMDWTIRKNMAIHLARGLQYLHSECKFASVIHGDFRSKNVFLNHDMVPVIGGFGQSRSQEGGHGVMPLNCETRWPKGYPWYVAPEYLEGGQISEKVDVYAFGIVLLELITCRSAADRSQRLVDWAQPWLESPPDYETLKKEMQEAQFMEKGQDCSEIDVMNTVHAARLCLRKDPFMRPRMSQVLEILENGHHDVFQDPANSCPLFNLKSSTDLKRKDLPTPTTNRTAPCEALATLRAADPADAHAHSFATRTKDNTKWRKDSLDCTEFRSPPSTPTFSDLIMYDSEFSYSASSSPSQRSSGAGHGSGSRNSKGTARVTQLLYRPLNNLTSSTAGNRPGRRVTFTKHTPTRLSYNEMLLQ